MSLLYLTILIPFLSAILLALFCGKVSKNTSSVIGVGSILITFIISLIISYEFLKHLSLIKGYIFEQTLWNWVLLDNFNISFTLMLDGLSLTMLCLITGVGFFIHLYASWYMFDKEGYSRFFVYTNLFISCMIILVLGNNMMLMYLGWEGVGLCSYLLINFYYTNPDNGRAAMKAFLITKTGDIFLAIAIFALWNSFGTLNFNEITVTANKFINNLDLISFITIMILIGAISKSAQFPLHTWLIDAMVGPTPVSALIHAATMITAGVYLIARTHVLFLLVPNILYFISLIGAITLIIGSFLAIFQSNIKRILAYSTMSQVGYMFLALGIQAWEPAIFHLMIHSFFKSLLFLSVGSIIIIFNNEQNIFNISGLRKKYLHLYVFMLVGISSLASIPLFTSGFYSKEKILYSLQLNEKTMLLYISIIGVFLTTIYSFRMFFLIFYGEEIKKIKEVNFLKKFSYSLPLVVLAILSMFIGALIHQPLEGVFPVIHFKNNFNKILLEIISSCFVFIGLLVTIFLYLNKNSIIYKINKTSTFCFLLKFFNVDLFYDTFFVKPFKKITYILKNDPINLFLDLFGYFLYFCGKMLSISENGQIRWYITSVVLGAILIFTFLFLI